MNAQRVTSKYPRSLEAQLLRAGQAMEPPRATTERVLAGLGLGSAVTLGSVAGKAAAGTAKAGAAAATATMTQAGGWGAGLGWIVTKYVGVGLFVGLSAYSATQLVEGGMPAVGWHSGSHPVNRAMASGTGAPRGATPGTTTVSEGASTVAACASRPKLPGLEGGSRADHGLGRGMTTEVSSREAGRLQREVSLIDGARRAMSQGNEAEALTLLGRHDREFRSPRLGEEATFLRVQALARTGRRGEARLVFEHLESAHPESPLLSALRAELSQAASNGSSGE